MFQLIVQYVAAAAKLYIFPFISELRKPLGGGGGEGRQKSKLELGGTEEEGKSTLKLSKAQFCCYSAAAASGYALVVLRFTGHHRGDYRHMHRRRSYVVHSPHVELGDRQCWRSSSVRRRRSRKAPFFAQPVLPHPPPSLFQTPLSRISLFSAPSFWN